MIEVAANVGFEQWLVFHVISKERKLGCGFAENSIVRGGGLLCYWVGMLVHYFCFCGNLGTV